MTCIGEAPPPATETLRCARCGFDWMRVRATGPKPRLCPDCLTQPAPPGEHLEPANRIDPLNPAYRVAYAAVLYRLTFEQLAPLIRMCGCNCPHQREALALLDTVEAPSRTSSRRAV